MSNSFTDILTAPGVDLTGRSPSNKVAGEIQTLNPPQYFDRHFLVPAKAPFFAEGVEVYKISTNPLTPPLKLDLGVDYFLSHKYAEASYWLSQDAPPRSLYASISFYDQEYTMNTNQQQTPPLNFIITKPIAHADGTILAAGSCLLVFIVYSCEFVFEWRHKSPGFPQGFLCGSSLSYQASSTCTVTMPPLVV
jgi:hypothetical protein